MARLAVLLLLTLSTAASANAELRVSEAIRLYDGGEFAAAKDTLVTVVDSPRLSDAQRARARIYLSASYYALGDIASAKAQLLALARAHPDATIDPALFVPELVALFDDAREEVRAETPRPPPVVEVAPPPPAEEPVEQVSAAPPRAPAALSLVPFGVGQFSNREPVKGWVFLAAEVALFATSGVTLALFEDLKVEGEFLRWGSFHGGDVGRAELLQTVYLAAFYVGLAVTAAGIGEAVLSRSNDGGASATLRFGGTSVLARF